MLRTLYHGSANRIETPKYGVGKTYNDYGLGFYCTEDLSLAKEWSVSSGKSGFANCYELDCDGLKVLNLNGKEYNILHWFAVLLENREFELSSPLAIEAKAYILDRFAVAYREYDAIIGYRADDSYFSFAQDFLNGAISFQQLSRAMVLGKLGMQYVLKSEKAFSKIKFCHSEEVDWEEWFPKRKQRDVMARREYLNGERNRRRRGDLFVAQIIDEEVGPDDPRLR